METPTLTADRLASLTEPSEPSPEEQREFHEWARIADVIPGWDGPDDGDLASWLDRVAAVLRGRQSIGTDWLGAKLAQMATDARGILGAESPEQFDGRSAELLNHRLCDAYSDGHRDRDAYCNRELLGY